MTKEEKTMFNKLLKITIGLYNETRYHTIQVGFGPYYHDEVLDFERFVKKYYSSIDCMKKDLKYIFLINEEE